MGVFHPHLINSENYSEIFSSLGLPLIFNLVCLFVHNICLFRLHLASTFITFLSYRLSILWHWPVCVATESIYAHWTDGIESLGRKKKIRNIFSQHQICVVDCCRKRCLEPEKKSTRQSHDHEVYDVFLCFSLFVSFGIDIVLLDFLSNSSIRTFICYMMSRRNGRVVKVVKKPMR